MSDVLRCECGTRITAMTGLQELQAIVAHRKKAHKELIGIGEAMELREKWESAQ